MSPGRFKVLSGGTPIVEGSSWMTKLVENKEYRHQLMFGELKIEGDEAACVQFAELVSILIARGVIKYHAKP